MKENKISIIIPAYNVEEYIEECIYSVIKQTYRNIEVIIINDGSTDNTAKVIKNLPKDNRIKIYEKKNGGLSDARNYGIKQSTGEYLFFLDGDDLILPETIQVLSKYANNNSISICNFDRFTNNYNKTATTHSRHKYTPISYYKSILRLENTTHACGALIPKRYFNDVRFPKGRYFEDLATMYKIYIKAKKITKVKAKLYKYRQNPNSITNNHSKNKAKHYYISASEMIDFIRSNTNIKEKLINTYLAYIYRECYIISKEKQYLKLAIQASRNSTLFRISMKNKIKIILLRVFKKATL